MLHLPERRLGWGGPVSSAIPAVRENEEMAWRWEGRLRLDNRKNNFTVWVVGHSSCNRLPRQVESPSLEEFKRRLDQALGDVVSGLQGHGCVDGWTWWSWKSLPALMIPWPFLSLAGGSATELPVCCRFHQEFRGSSRGKAAEFSKDTGTVWKLPVAPHVLTYCGFLFRVSKYLLMHLEAQAVQNVISDGLWTVPMQERFQNYSNRVFSSYKKQINGVVQIIRKKVRINIKGPQKPV